jgi:hypothetical protein
MAWRRERAGIRVFSGCDGDSGGICVSFMACRLTFTITRIITHVKTFAWNQFCCTFGTGKLQGRVARVGGSENRE